MLHNLLRRIVPPVVKDRVLYPMWRIGLRTQLFTAATQELWLAVGEGRPVPPPWLRYRVTEEIDRASFVRVGEDLTDRVSAILDERAFRLEKQRVLDFGCGCGRLLRGMTGRFPRASYLGCDTDNEAINWCQRNFPTGAFICNQAIPPVAMPKSSADVLIAVSVLTHLDQPSQHAWVAEWARLLDDDGILLASVHSESVWRGHALAERVGNDGFAFVESRKPHGIMPSWYQTAFQTRRWTEQLFASSFEEVHWVTGGFGAHDVVVARRPKQG